MFPPPAAGAVQHIIIKQAHKITGVNISGSRNIVPPAGVSIVRIPFLTKIDFPSGPPFRYVLLSSNEFDIINSINN